MISCGLEVIPPEAFGLDHGKGLFQGESFDWPGDQLFAAAGPSIGLCDNADDLPTCPVSRTVQGGKGGKGEVGRAHENDTDGFDYCGVGGCRLKDHRGYCSTFRGVVWKLSARTCVKLI